jgi:drug/metabolite transporter (DMT)-like permease
MSQRLHESVVGFYYGVGNLFFCPCWIGFFQQRTTYPTYSIGMALHILLIGFAYFIFKAMMNWSMKYLTAAASSILLYVTIPTSYFLDYLFFNQKINTIDIIGACLIVVSNVSIGVLKAKGIIK